MNSSGYKIFFLLHIVAIVVAFAPAFVWPFVSVRLKKQNKPVGPAIAELASGNSAKIHGPALVLAGLFGFAMIGMSNKLLTFKQTWVSIAMVVWFAMIGVIFGLMVPNEKKAAAGDADADKKMSMFGGILHLLFFVMLYLMIWKPGAPAGL